MGRQRIKLNEGEIEARAARGESAETIAQALGGTVTDRTIRRRMRELRGLQKKSVRSARSSVSTASEESSPPDLDATAANLEGALDRILAQAERAFALAEERKNLTAIGQMGRLVVMIQEAKRKSAPLPKPDPNESPDMVQLASEVAARFHKLVDQVTDAVPCG